MWQSQNLSETYFSIYCVSVSLSLTALCLSSICHLRVKFKVCKGPIIIFNFKWATLVKGFLRDSLEEMFSVAPFSLTFSPVYRMVIMSVILYNREPTRHCTAGCVVLNSISRSPWLKVLPLDNAHVIVFLLQPGRGSESVFAPYRAGVDLHTGGVTRRLLLPHGWDLWEPERAPEAGGIGQYYLTILSAALISKLQCIRQFYPISDGKLLPKLQAVL